MVTTDNPNDILEVCKRRAFLYLMLNTRGAVMDITDQFGTNPWHTRRAIDEMEREGVVEVARERRAVIFEGRIAWTPNEYQLTGRRLAAYMA